MKYGRVLPHESLIDEEQGGVGWGRPGLAKVRPRIKPGVNARQTGGVRQQLA